MSGPTWKKILIIQTAFVGDVILATAVVEKLIRAFPESQIDFLLRKGNEPLLENHPHLRKIHILEKSRHKYWNLISMIRQLHSEQYDVAINIQRFTTTGILTVLSGATITIGFDKNPLSRFFSKKVKHSFGQIHETERNQRLVEWFTDPMAAKPRLYPTPEQFKLVEKYKKLPYLCMAPASVWFTKQFPEDKWVELLKYLNNMFQVYLVGGQGDHDLSERIIRKSSSTSVKNLCGEISLLETAALMKDSFLNITNDSAPLHIASAMNAPVCAIYCSTVPAFGFGPLSDRSFIIEPGEKMDCRPCGIHGRDKCPLEHFDCAGKISLAKLKEIIYSEARRAGIHPLLQDPGENFNSKI